LLGLISNNGSTRLDPLGANNPASSLGFASYFLKAFLIVPNDRGCR